MVAEPLIVVADDNPDILGLVKRRLSKRGYCVETASDGEQALDLIQSKRPAVAVLDWMMPGLQGIEVCQRLREDEATREIPIVMLTARAAEGDITSGFEHGADEYLTKPFDIDELDQTLKRLLGS